MLFPFISESFQYHFISQSLRLQLGSCVNYKKNTLHSRACWHLFSITMMHLMLWWMAHVPSVDTTVISSFAKFLYTLVQHDDLKRGCQQWLVIMRNEFSSHFLSYFLSNDEVCPFIVFLLICTAIPKASLNVVMLPCRLHDVLHTDRSLNVSESFSSLLPAKIDWFYCTCKQCSSFLSLVSCVVWNLLGSASLLFQHIHL